MSRQQKRRNIELYNSYTTSSIGYANNNEILTRRQKHLYFDSREDVRQRGKEQTTNKGMFRTSLVSSLKNVKKITVHQITVPGVMHNVSNREVELKVNGSTKRIVYNDMVLTKDTFDSFQILFQVDINTFFNQNGVTDVNKIPQVEFLFSELRETVSIKVNTPLGGVGPITVTWSINFNPSIEPTQNLGPMLGWDRQQGLIEGNEYGALNGVVNFEGLSVPDLNGFNYMLIRCPELNLNAEFNLTEVDNHKKNNILARVPVNYNSEVMTFDKNWFQPHFVDINILKTLTFEFSYYNGSKPSFQNENVSLVLIVDYMDN
mgnify:CR=1 FL=1